MAQGFKGQTEVINVNSKDMPSVEAALTAKLQQDPSIDQQPFLQGYLAVDSLWLYLNNGNVIGGGQPTLTGPSFIDKSNIDAVSEYAKNGTR